MPTQLGTVVDSHVWQKGARFDQGVICFVPRRATQEVDQDCRNPQTGKLHLKTVRPAKDYYQASGNLMNENTTSSVKESAAGVNDSAPIRKMMLILSKATLDNVYACFILANGARMEGIEAEIFFTFFGLEAIKKKSMEHLHVATVGNPAMHIPTMLGSVPGVEALASGYMKKEMERLDIPGVEEFLQILEASGVKLWACKLAMDMFHLDENDLFDDIEGVLTVGDFYGRAKGEGTHVLFI